MLLYNCENFTTFLRNGRDMIRRDGKIDFIQMSLQLILRICRLVVVQESVSVMNLQP